MLNKKYRLRKRKDFSYVYRRGGKFRGKYLIVYYLRYKELNIGFSVSKKIGKAVTRNLFKRRLRHIAYEYMDQFTTCRYIFIAKDNITQASYEELREDIASLLIRISSTK